MGVHNDTIALYVAGQFPDVQCLNALFQERAVNCAGHKKIILVAADKLLAQAKKKKNKTMHGGLTTLKKVVSEVTPEDFGKQIIDLPMLLALGLELRGKYEPLEVS